MGEPFWCGITVELPPAEHPAWQVPDGEDQSTLVALLDELFVELEGRGCRAWSYPSGAPEWWEEVAPGQHVTWTGELNYGWWGDDEMRLDRLAEMGVQFDAWADPKYEMSGEYRAWRHGWKTGHRLWEPCAEGGEFYVTVGQLERVFANHRGDPAAAVAEIKAMFPCPWLVDSKVAV